MARAKNLKNLMIYNGVDLREMLAVDGDGMEVDSSWIGYREGGDTRAHVRRMDDRGSTDEVSVIALEADADSLLVGELVFASDLALAQLKRKLHMLSECCSAGTLACDAGVYDFWF